MYNGIILLDGADCVGKTTLAGRIAEVAGKLGQEAVICHLGKPAVGDCWREHSEALLHYITEAYIHKKLVIADRHFMSEAIYGKVYRTGSEYPFAARHIDRLLSRFRALRVICAPPVEVVVENHAKMKQVRFEDYDSGMDQVAQAYLDLWYGSRPTSLRDDTAADYVEQLSWAGGVSDRLGWYHYDFTQQGDGDTYARFLLAELKSERELAPEATLSPVGWNFTGFASPYAVLLVGDRLSAENPLNIPFFANSACSNYLAKTLHACEINEDLLAIANINDPDGFYTVRALQEMCGKTIVMGREAEKSMMQHGLRMDARIRHPQHAARFSHHSTGYELEMDDAFGSWSRLPSIL